MNEKFQLILQYLINADERFSVVTDLNIFKQFETKAKSEEETAQKINAAFLIILAGKSNELCKEAEEYFNDMKNDTGWKNIISFYQSGLELINKEVLSYSNQNPQFDNKINQLIDCISDAENIINQKEALKRLREIFFPEGALPANETGKKEKVQKLREKRKISIKHLNKSPITNPVKEILFTSNILAAVPLKESCVDSLSISDSIKKKLRQVMTEDQQYWYDHPIPIGVSPEENEALYGINGLDEMMRFEKEKGNADKNSKLTCLLSASTTHNGLHEIIKEYFEQEYKKSTKIKNLDVYIFSESDAQRLLKEILIPVAQKYLANQDTSKLNEIFGVDGEYGRHYTFLKAIAAFWQVFINPEIKATFKIDLDQVFPQKELARQSGCSALDHFKTSLWGAEGIDYWGRTVELGMIAGALVNAGDIKRSLFYPDIRFPEEASCSVDELIFYSRLPQALSTEAEMMTRYDDNCIESKQVIQRIHVTGGTNGILIDALRRYRPFTPVMIGRAEDQAYLLSVLFEGSPALRYVHKAGLIMRHDKKAFARQAIESAAVGKMIGDYIRILLFSYYARALPWSVEEIKEAVNPFTGCFVSEIPLTIVYLRFSLKAASMFGKHENNQALEFLKMGGKRLSDIIGYLNDDPNPLIKQYEKEKSGWNLYYDILDTAEKGIAQNDNFLLELRKKAQKLALRCKVDF